MCVENLGFEICDRCPQAGREAESSQADNGVNLDRDRSPGRQVSLGKVVSQSKRRYLMA
jgi:hypothetical protein